ncbi:calcium uniporter protein 2, mitochondrial-like [Rutidosis leptorrhynchoides]|uniref:calcium uniporter protein 2, mitochondrial-like n=1 Tax=Rutidosis leptorrhynchoides TaxID=125765 RepID=UPI003A9A2C4B
MAFKKSLVERLFNMSRISASQTIANCRISSSTAVTAGARSRDGRIAPDPGDSNNNNGLLFRRFLHKGSSSAAASAVFPLELRSLFLGENNLSEKIKEIDLSKDRIRLDALSPPFPPPATAETPTSAVNGLTGEEVRKLLRVAQMEMVKAKLRKDMDDKSWIPYSDLVRVCTEVCSDSEQGIRVVNMLDQSGSVTVLGNVVFLKPEQITKAIEGLVSLMGPDLKNDPRRKEFEELECRKAEIDQKAKELVQRELWAGLGYFAVQTAGFMRLTFWELTWDVMEPICFFITSMYFMGAYTFFLRTAKEPTFEGLYQSRFDSKQKKLMKMNNFDVERYNELRKIFYPYYISGEAASSPAAGMKSLFI